MSELRKQHGLFVNIFMYHGGRWLGDRTLRASRGRPKGTAKSRTEAGPGLYLTNVLSSARRYARGGGRVWLFELKSDLQWLEESEISRHDMENFLYDTPRMTSRKDIQEDLSKYDLRTGDTGVLPASVLVNLMVNYNALKGDRGLALASFLVAHGIDASEVHHSGDEYWVVLFNLEKIVNVHVSGSGGRAHGRDLPEVLPRASQQNE